MIPILAMVLAVVFPCAAAAQHVVLHIAVLEGEGAVHAPGARSSRPLTVAVTDDAGHPVAGASVSFMLPDEGPGGTFANGLRTELVRTGSDGRAGVRNLRVNRVPGRFEVRIGVVWRESRAGMISFQYIAPVKPGTERASAGRRKKWIALLLAGAGGGIAAGVLGGAGGQAAAPDPPLSVGMPTITVGRP